LDLELELRDLRFAGAFERADEVLLERPPELLLERPPELLLERPPELLLERPPELLLELLLERFVLRFVFALVPDVARPLLLLDVPRRIAMRRDSATSVPTL
jgi:hypothetical protein